MERSNKLNCRYGKLIVVGSAPSDERGNARWECACDCGGAIVVTSGNLATGNTKSCGCCDRSLRAQKRPGESGFNYLYSQYVASARKRNLVFELSKDEFRAITSLPCSYCGVEPRQRKRNPPGTSVHGEYKYNGIDRVDNAVGYTVDNCVPCCTTCNYAKGKMLKSDFLVWIQRIADFHARPK